MKRRALVLEYVRNFRKKTGSRRTKLNQTFWLDHLCFRKPGTRWHQWSRFRLNSRRLVHDGSWETPTQIFKKAPKTRKKFEDNEKWENSRREREAKLNESDSKFLRDEHFRWGELKSPKKKKKQEKNKNSWWALKSLIVVEQSEGDRRL